MEGIGRFLEFDRRLLRTIGVLTLRPGTLTVAFALGDRERYVSPVRLALVLGLVGFGAGLLTPEGARGWLFLLASFRTGSLGKLAPWAVMIGILPVLATIARGLIRTASFTTHLVFYLHLQSFFFLVFVLEAAWFFVLGTPARWPTLLLGALYAILALRRVHGDGWGRTALQALVVAGSYFMVGMAVVLLDEWGWFPTREGPSGG